MFRLKLFLYMVLFFHLKICAQDVYKNELIEKYLPEFLESIPKRKVRKFFDEKPIYFYDNNSYRYIYPDSATYNPSAEMPQLLKIERLGKTICVYFCEVCMYSFSEMNGSVMLHIGEGVENSRKVVYCQIYKIRKVKEIVLENGNHTDMYIMKIILSRKFKVSEDR